MSPADGLLAHAWKLVLSDADEDELKDAKLRRSVSAAFYSLFHRLTADAATLIAPHLPPQTNHRIQRWFDHAEMKKVCTRFLPATLDQPLRNLLGESTSPRLQSEARAFIQTSGSSP